MQLNFLDKLLIDIADEKGIEIDFFSYNYIIRLKKNNEIKYIIGSDLGLNSSTSSKIATDKSCTHMVLNQNLIPSVEHIFIDESNKSDLEKSSIYNYDIVVKPNKGEQGKDVVHVNNYDLILKESKKIIKKEGSVTISPFYDIKEEYRTIYLNGKCLITYAKDRPFVIGNGENSIRELVKINSLKDIDFHKLDSEISKYVPRKNEKIYVSWKHNLSLGSRPRIIEDKQKLNEIHKIVKEAGKAINIKFASIDVIELHDGKLMVLEVNSTVCMKMFSEYEKNGYEISKKVFSDAIDILFKN